MSRRPAFPTKALTALLLAALPLLSLAERQEPRRSTDYAKLVQSINSRLPQGATIEEQRRFVERMAEKYRTDCRVVVVEQVVGAELFPERAEYDSLNSYLENVATMAYLNRKPEILFLFYHSDSLFLKELIEPR